MAVNIQGRVREVPSERGLESICVSNGEHIVQTDVDGRYALEIEPGDHRFIFVTVPDGFRPRGNFYQSALGWTDPQQGVDFKLAPAPRGDRRTFLLAHITDTHVVVEGNRPLGKILAQDLQQLIQEAAPDLIVVSGDLTDWGTLPELKSFHEAIGTISTLVLPMFGGHDGNKERFGDLTIEELVELKHRKELAKIQEILKEREGTTFTRNYEQVLGPAYYSFDWGGRHCVLYPNEENFFSPADRKRKESWFRADLDLQPGDREVVVLVHKPPSVSFLETLSRYNTRLVLHGHCHSSKVFAHGRIVVAATPALCFGGIDTSPRGYRLVDFREEDLQFEFRPLRRTGGSSLPGGRDVPPPISLDDRDRSLYLLWEHQLPVGLHRAAPVCSGEQILLSLADEGHPGGSGVTCVDSRSGRLLWRMFTETSVKNSVAAASPGGSAKEDRELCAAVTVAGRVYVLETESGQIRWQADLPGFPERWIYASPVIADRTVYAGGRSGYGAYDLETGAQRWYTEIEGGDGWPCYASPQVCEDLLIVLLQGRGLMALDRQNGAVVWERELGVANPYARPAVAGDLLVSGSDAPNLHWFDGDPAYLAVLQVRSGEVFWNRPVLPSRYPTGLVVREDRMYATTPDGEALCFDLHSGELLWRFQTGDDLQDMIPARREVQSILAAPVLFGEHLLICGCDGCLYVLNAQTGTCKSRSPFSSPITASPCLTEDGFCLGTYDGRLYCYSRGDV